MKKAVYKNMKSGKLYTFEAKEVPTENGDKTVETTFFNVYDNAEIYDKTVVQVDKKGKAFKVLELEPITLKNGVAAYKTIK